MRTGRCIWYTAALAAGIMVFLAGCGAGSREEEGLGNREESAAKESSTVDRQGGSAQENQEETASGIPQANGDRVPVAEFQEIRYDMENPYGCALVGDMIYYMEWNWLKDIEERQMKLYRTAADGTGVPELVLQEDPGKRFIDAFYVDRENYLYLSGREVKDGKTLNYLQKQSTEGEVLYCTYHEKLPSVPSAMWTGFADGEGNSALIEAQSGMVYLFDKEGAFAGSGVSALTQGQLVDAGEQGVYLWERDWNQGDFQLQRLDFAKGELKDLVSVKLPEEMQSQYSDCVPVSGYEKGLLISTERNLWQYDLDTKSGTKLLEWQAPTVNIDGSTVKQLWFGEDAADGSWEWKALLGGFGVPVTELARISYVDPSELPEREQVVVGAVHAVNFDRLVRSFNRGNKEYEVKLMEYDEEQLMEALMFGKEVPDVLDTKWISTELLAGKGLLADLEPYFENSSVVNREALLEPVWEAGCVNGKMTGAVTGFTIQSLATTAEEVAGEGWTIEEFFALEQNHPESMMLEFCYPVNIFSIVAETELNRFIDWEDGSCSFDGPEFTELLRQMGKMRYTQTRTDQKIFYEDEAVNNFLSGEFLLKQDYIFSPESYRSMMEKYDKRARQVGYPNREGKPWFLFNVNQQFAIYNESPCKDGAWAFIEFLLSQEEQSRFNEEEQIGFPVRRDAFDAYLDRSYQKGESGKAMDEKLAGEYREALRYMVENSYMGQDDRSTAGSMIYEELEAFIAGDKTAEETARLIQTRVQLYLDEQ